MVDGRAGQGKVMDAKRRLFLTVAEAALLLTVGSWALIFVYAVYGRDISPHGAVLAVTVVIVPDALASWWIFRRLLIDRPRRDAWRAATAFAVSAPVTLALAYLLSAVVGGYAETFLGRKSALPAIAILIIILMMFVPGTVVAWTLHPSGGVQPVGERHEDEHR